MKPVYTFIHHNAIWGQSNYFGIRAYFVAYRIASLFLPNFHFGFCQEVRALIRKGSSLSQTSWRL